MTLKPRELAESLTLERVLGRGGFSTVYRAVWLRPGSSAAETVSVKVLLPKYCDASSVHWHQFVAEATFMCSCSHPNVLKCHGLVLLPKTLPGLKDTYSGPVLAMVLDYIKGGTLLQLLTTQIIEPHSKVYSLREGLGVLADVAGGLAHLHEQRPAVLHRDIKPGNVLLHKQDAGRGGGSGAKQQQRLTAQIADFGLHVVLDDTRPVLLRRSGSVRASRSAENLPALEGNVFYSLASFTAADAPGRGRSPLAPRPPLVPTKSRKALSGELGHAVIAGGLSSDCILTTVEPRGASRGSGSTLVFESAGSFSGVVGIRGASSGGYPGQQGVVRPGSPVPAGAEAQAVRRVLRIRTSATMGSKAAESDDGTNSGPHAIPPLSSCSSSVHGEAVKVSASAAAGGSPSALAASFTVTPRSERPASGDLTEPEPCITETLVDIDGDVAEWVFDLTEDTGSLVYMAPEVKAKMPYNTKADVYSFGVLMYEVLGRTLLAKTCIGDNKIRNPEDFLKRVGAGWRPDRPLALAPELWCLVEACWHKDPNQRPAMGSVAEQLLLLQEDLAPGHVGEPSCACTIS